MEKSVTFTGACANEIIPSINRSFVYKAKEERYVRTVYKHHFAFRSQTYIAYVHLYMLFAALNKKNVHNGIPKL